MPSVAAAYGALTGVLGALSCFLACSRISGRHERDQALRAVKHFLDFFCVLDRLGGWARFSSRRSVSRRGREVGCAARGPPAAQCVDPRGSATARLPREAVVLLGPIIWHDT